LDRPARASASRDIVRRVNNVSPWFPVSDQDIDLFLSYSGVKTNGSAPEAFSHMNIAPKALDMINQATQLVVASVFLFDNMYASNAPPVDLVNQFTDLLIAKKEKHPGIRIAAVLDPMHRAYGDRESPAVRRLREHGVDIFYSDLLDGLKAASFVGLREGLGHTGRLLSRLTFGGWGHLTAGLGAHVPMPGDMQLDGEPFNAQMMYNALLLKANHRKLLVTDSPDGSFEALVSSANPHNASWRSANSALSVKGDTARYIHNVIREDIAHSIALGSRYCSWRDGADRAYRSRYLRDTLPALPIDASGDSTALPRVRFVSEAQIARAIIAMLDAAQPDDEIRIQMFYLSYQPVLDAIVRTAKRVDRPIRLLLDANKDSFNKEKNGTPNRQVAQWLLAQKAKGANLEIRWYATHGEQNHAKIMSISNLRTGKRELTTGSCNWTGRNMAGVNMECNLVVEGAGKLNRQFENMFDMLWTNGGGSQYSLDYETFKDAASHWAWVFGEAPFYYSAF
jgi:hypothetical protein